MHRPSSKLCLPLLMLTAVGACKRAAPKDQPAAAPHVDAVALHDAGTTAAAAGPLGVSADPPALDAKHPAILAFDETSPLRIAQPIGHTSTVYLVVDKSERRFVFKPDTKHGKGRFRGELGAYQLAEALGVSARLPRVFPVSFTRSSLRAIVAGKAARQNLDEDVVDTHGLVLGAGIEWVDELKFPKLHHGAVRVEWESWLEGKRWPESPQRRQFAGALSDMVLFDYITGNFDRFSGGNIGQVGGDDAPVLYIDNDGGLMWPEASKAIEKQRALMLRTVKFNHGMISVVRQAAKDSTFMQRVLAMPAPIEPFPAGLLKNAQKRLQEVADHAREQCDGDGDPCVVF